MSYCRQMTLPAAEVITLAQAKNYLRVGAGFTDDDALILGHIQAAREHAETVTGRAIAQRTFRLVLDSHPYYTDTIQSQLAYPPSYYSLPRYSTTLWNYSQMIKLPFSPVISVQQMRYVATDGNPVELHQDTDFILDRDSEPARIFPMPGQYWPADLYVANACEIDFTAGYDPDPTKTDTHNVTEPVPPEQQPDSIIVTGIPQLLRTAMLMYMAQLYDQRWGDAGPERIDNMLYNFAIVDFAPSRG
jgi:hypothetical protein